METAHYERGHVGVRRIIDTACMSLTRLRPGAYRAGNDFLVERVLEPFTCVRSHRIRGGVCLGGKFHAGFVWQVWSLHTGVLVGEFRSLTAAKASLR